MVSLISPSLPFLFLLILHQSSSFSTVDVSADSDIIIETCNRCASSDPNVNYTLCVASLESVPKARQSDLQGLAVVAVRLAKSNMTRAKSKAKNLLKAKSLDPYMESCLETCRELYSNSIADLEDSVKAIKSSRYGDANILISSAVDVPRTCEDGFDEEGLQSPLSEENDELFGLTVIALAITSLLG
ncbi:putative invertase inhibitor [Ananas comosus]|uniref:Invertase inhibitor n=1 Tax=Ananas comosus TaxID=4615 RepID=A0A6P5H609_ANACO|nr:putative invertase inhibitor [Ananas comosus]